LFAFVLFVDLSMIKSAVCLQYLVALNLESAVPL